MSTRPKQAASERRRAYERGRAAGGTDVLAGHPYDSGSDGPEETRHAFSLGYADGWAENNPCENCTCGHLAHTTPPAPA